MAPKKRAAAGQAAAAVPKKAKKDADAGSCVEVEHCKS